MMQQAAYRAGPPAPQSMWQQQTPTPQPPPQQPTAGNPWQQPPPPQPQQQQSYAHTQMQQQQTMQQQQPQQHFQQQPQPPPAYGGSAQGSPVIHAPHQQQQPPQQQPMYQPQPPQQPQQTQQQHTTQWSAGHHQQQTNAPQPPPPHQHQQHQQHQQQQPQPQHTGSKPTAVMGHSHSPQQSPPQHSSASANGVGARPPTAQQPQGQTRPQQGSSASSSSSAAAVAAAAAAQRDLLSVQAQLNSVPPGFPFTNSALGSAMMGSIPAPAAAPETLFGNDQFSDEESARIQLLLERKLAAEEMATRVGGGKAKLWYVETHQSINLANYIFDFNGWSSSIKEFSIDFMTEREGRWSMGISCIVRVQLKDGAYHEDIGYGICSNMPDRGAAIEKVKKEAASDALKRTLRLFGNGLGNCIYDKEYLAKVAKGAVISQPLDMTQNRPGSKKRNRFMPMSKEEVAQQNAINAYQAGAAAAAAHRPTQGMPDGMSSAAAASAAAGMSSYAASVSSPGAPRAVGVSSSVQGSPKVSKLAYGQSPASAQNLATSSTGFGTGHTNSPVVKMEQGPPSPSMGLRPPAPNFAGNVPQQQQHQQQHHTTPPQQQSIWSAAPTSVAPPPAPATPQQPAWQAALQSNTAHSMGLGHPQQGQAQQPQAPTAQSMQQQRQPMQQQSHQSVPVSNPYASHSAGAQSHSYAQSTSSSAMSSSSMAATSSTTQPSTSAHAGLFPSAPAANQTYVPSSMRTPVPASSSFTSSSFAGSSSSMSATASTAGAPPAAAGGSTAAPVSRVDDDLDEDALLTMADRHSPQKPKENVAPHTSSSSATAEAAKRSLQPVFNSKPAAGTDERKEGSPPARSAFGAHSNNPYLTQQPSNGTAKQQSPPPSRGLLTSADLLGDADHETNMSRSL